MCPFLLEPSYRYIQVALYLVHHEMITDFVCTGKLTEKSDVYAYGVVLLELLFGRKPIDKSLPSECQSLISWVCIILFCSSLY